MAKSRIRYTDAPAKNGVYVGMLALTAAVGFLGIGVFALEANEYDWDSQAKVFPAPTLPKINSEPADKAGGGNRPVDNPGT